MRSRQRLVLRLRFCAAVMALIPGGCASSVAGAGGAGVDTESWADSDSDSVPPPDCLSDNAPAGLCVVSDGWTGSEFAVSGVVTEVGLSGAVDACEAHTLASPAAGEPSTLMAEAPWFEIEDGNQKWVFGLLIPGATIDVAGGGVVDVAWAKNADDDFSTFSIGDASGVVAWLSEWSALPLSPPGFSSNEGDMLCHSEADSDTGVSLTSRSERFWGPSGTELILAPGEMAPLDGYLVGAPANVRESDIGAPDRFYDKVVAFARIPK